ncbi:protease pro-enzyme activation domain-containing protein [Streptomyces sp. NPDC059468]|uniref:S53 family peptidase n=1 Tax=Streptomyces sp. NPDC059468 TaxID=3346845 RepID=UPI0036C9798D
MSEQHVALAGSTRPAKADATRLRDADAHDPVTVTVTLRGKVAPAGQVPEGRLQDAAKTKAVLERYGLTVDEERLEPGSIVASGSAAAMNAAFKADLGIYHSAEQGEFRGREGELKIPAELEGIVTGVFGLDQRQVARRLVAGGSGFQGSFTPEDLELLYNFPTGDGAGQKIAIAEFGGCYFDDDLRAFCAAQNRPVPRVEVVPVDFDPPRSLQEARQLPPAEQKFALEAAGEVMMDVQIVAALCPAAEISVYFADFDQRGWIEVLDRVIAQQPVTLSVSWGLAEDDPNWSGTALDQINKRLEGAADRGTTVCVSSGDDGAGDQVMDGRAHVDFPSSSPFVLSVGGTMIDASGTEVSWWVAPGRRVRGKPGSGSSGGGVSTKFERPDYQQQINVDSLNPGAFKGRVVPDVAALAGPPFYDLTLFGAPEPNGGTSASAPLWAALYARVNALLPQQKQQRFLTPLLYRSGNNGVPLGQAACRDIAEGHDNASHPPAVGYPVKPGYDAVTGWGVPDGTALEKGL